MIYYALAFLRRLGESIGRHRLRQPSHKTSVSPKWMRRPARMTFLQREQSQLSFA